MANRDIYGRTQIYNEAGFERTEGINTVEFLKSEKRALIAEVKFLQKQIEDLKEKHREELMKVKEEFQSAMEDGFQEYYNILTTRTNAKNKEIETLKNELKSKTDNEIDVAKMKLKKLEELKLQVMAQNPSILGAKLKG